MGHQRSINAIWNPFYTLLISEFESYFSLQHIFYEIEQILRKSGKHVIDKLEILINFCEKHEKKPDFQICNDFKEQPAIHSHLNDIWYEKLIFP